MDVASIKYDSLIDIKKEDPEALYLTDFDSEFSEFDFSECTQAFNDLFEALPKERKNMSLTKESIVIEATNYALELEQILQDKENNMKDLPPSLKSKNFPFKTKEEIKRPRNGFIRFAMKYRAEMATKHPNLDNRNISCLLGMQWKKMTEEERKPYEEEFKEDMKMLREMHPNWVYTPKKSKTEEELDAVVLPTRLRPKEKRKRKVLYSFEEIYPTSSKQKSKSHGCRRRTRKKIPSIAEEKPSSHVDMNCMDLPNGSFVDTILMPPPGGPNLINDLVSGIENEKLTPLERNRTFNTDYFSIDWENQILESMLDNLTHPWLQGVDHLTKLSVDDLLQDQI